MRRLDSILTDTDDPRLVELRAQVQATKPYEPKPGDPDYLTPAQRAWIKRGCPERQKAKRV